MTPAKARPPEKSNKRVDRPKDWAIQHVVTSVVLVGDDSMVVEVEVDGVLFLLAWIRVWM
jgi:hypothetical protein